MMIQVLKSEILKIKRKLIWFLILLGPVGVISLQAVNYGLRYDYLVKPGDDVWGDLLLNVNMFVPVTLGLGITIIASMTANIEHQQTAWKQLLALPVSRTTVYVAKFCFNFLLLLLSCILLWIGTMGLGVALKFGFDIPTFAIFKNSVFPLFAAIPIVALQLWLSITFKNQSIPLTIGILGAVFSMYSFDAPDWLIWKWPLLGSVDHGAGWFISLGIAVGLVIFVIGMLDFKKRDVK